MIDGRYDFAIVSHTPTSVEEIVMENGGHATDVVTVLLSKQHMCVIASHSTPEGRELATTSARKTIPLAQLRKWELVGLDQRSGIRQQLERQFSRPDDLHFLAEGGGWAAAKEFVRFGIGVAILPLATMSPGDRDDFVIRRLSDTFDVGHFLLYRRDEMTASQEAVMATLQRAAELHRREQQQRWK